MASEIPWRELESDFDRPALDVDEASLVEHFRRRGSSADPLLRNYHREARVAPNATDSARPSATAYPSATT